MQPLIHFHSEENMTKQYNLNYLLFIYWTHSLGRELCGFSVTLQA